MTDDNTTDIDSILGLTPEPADTEAADPDFDRRVGANVARYRKATGFSQADLAAAISTPGEGVHQQTILKIEKGTRPLKFSEADKIAHVLRISPAQLMDGVRRAQRNAELIARHTELARITDALTDAANDLASALIHLATTVSEHLGTEEPEQPDPDLIQDSRNWLRTDWGHKLNAQLLQAVREHPHLVIVRPELDAPTYDQILNTLSHNATHNDGHADDPET
ncbi:helix-turn-helix domain-containing protein [Mycobacteroides abscessus]|uniref:helix-turn-helix domain-containing protein n=1 Tax=Mycobacteroides abscessus TaxID=36809 RepID=UPI0019CF7DBC|nr:helix-turn-helix transcriptional regulator [Mycobacteroides abscessus]MBN7559489.1 helix-turn-helix transcriptional regulator [Mycobacteroides abscessus subsp. abscessus]